MGFLEKALKVMDKEMASTRMKSLCPTRWVERHVVLASFKKSIKAIFAALKEIEVTEKGKISEDAENLIKNFYSFT